MTVMLVVIGGGLGAVLRWVMTAWLGTGARGFPIGTTTVNVVGSLTLGLVVGLDTSVGSSVADPLAIGLLGGFTTFSTWMVDIDQAITTRDRIIVGAVPMIAGFVAAIMGLSIGSLVSSVG